MSNSDQCCINFNSVCFTSDGRALVEKSIRDQLQSQLGGVTEEYIPSVGRIDLSLPDLIIEVKNVNDWMHGALAWPIDDLWMFRTTSIQTKTIALVWMHRSRENACDRTDL
jgi:hypothetical protein